MWTWQVSAVVRCQSRQGHDWNQNYADYFFSDFAELLLTQPDSTTLKKNFESLRDSPFNTDTSSLFTFLFISKSKDILLTRCQRYVCETGRLNFTSKDITTIAKVLRGCAVMKGEIFFCSVHQNLYPKSLRYENWTLSLWDPTRSIPVHIFLLSKMALLLQTRSFLLGRAKTASCFVHSVL